MAAFGVLGTLMVRADAGNELRLRGERQRTLLAMLLVDAGKRVPTDTLVEALWPDGPPPKSYASNLHTYVSRLRERLTSVGVDGSIDNTQGGYRLRVSSEDVDLRVFESEAAAGRRAAQAGHAGEAAVHLRRALAQWRGPVLADVRAPILDPVVARLEAERLTVFEDLADAELTAGGHAELVGELEGFLAEHPLRERAAAALMLALRRSGRQAEALGVYARMRRALLDELGVEPGRELREAHATVLRRDEPRQRAGHGTGPTTGQSTGSGAGNVTRGAWPICQLPPGLGDFSGREAELHALHDHLRDTGGMPVAVLSGEPGAGKSALAVQLAHRLRETFPDGQLFAHLSGASAPRRPGDVLAELLGALGVTGSALPDDLHARSAAYRSRLADRRVLVVLDDAVSAEQLRPLLPGTPGCAVLVTSRRRLTALEGAHRVPLGPLGDAEAMRFLERVTGAERVATEPGEAQRIVAACGRLPLALRIAGTRLAIRQNLPLATLADRLDNERHRLDELAVSDRQVRTSIAPSYDALSPLARSAIRALALCGKVGAPMWAIAMLVSDDGPGAEAAVEELVEASLLAPDGIDGTGRPRYRLHDLVRVFAREQPGPWPPLGRLIDATLGLADSAARQLPWTVALPPLPATLPEQPLPTELVARLVDDPHAWFATEQSQLRSVLSSFFEAGRCAEAQLLLERHGTYLWLHGHYTDLYACHQELRQLARNAGEKHIQAWAEANLAIVVHARGELSDAERRYRRCISQLEELGDRELAAWVVANLARCVLGLGRPDESLDTAGKALERLGRTPSTTAVRHIELLRAEAYAWLGMPGDSVLASRRTVAAARLSGEPLDIALALRGLAWSLTLTGELCTARQLAEESVAFLRPMPVSSLLAKSLRTLGAILSGLGERERAVAAYTEAHRLARELNERPRELSCARAIAASWIGDGRADEAIPVLLEGLAEYRTMGSVAAEAITLRVLARAYEVIGDGERACETLREAQRVRKDSDASASAVSSALLALAGEAGHALCHAPGSTPSSHA